MLESYLFLLIKENNKKRRQLEITLIIAQEDKTLSNVCNYLNKVFLFYLNKFFLFSLDSTFIESS